MNPFPITQYQGSQTFCDRENETERVISGLKNGQNFTILSLRRIGKTGLIKHILHQLTDKKEVYCLYVDIQFTQNQSEFALVLAKEIARIFPIHKGIGRKFLEAIKSLRPKLSFDALTGTPELGLDVIATQIKENTIQDILTFLDAQGVPIVIAIDEFQQIVKYPEKNTEALLRATMQQVKNIRFIYSGSDQHLMHELFQSAKRPFFASCSPLFLTKIDEQVYAAFITRQFEQNKRNTRSCAVNFATFFCTHILHAEHLSQNFSSRK